MMKISVRYWGRFRKGVAEMEMIKLHSLDDFQNMPVNKWNIKQPPDDEARESVFDTGNIFYPLDQQKSVFGYPAHSHSPMTIKQL